MRIDVHENRASRKWPVGVQLARVLWSLAYPLFRLSPRVFWGWRRLLLRCFGADIGKNVHIYPTVRIMMPWNLTIEDFASVGDHATLYALGTIRICARATISQGAHLCAGTHDQRRPDRRLLKPPIKICQDSWICADAFVGPGVTVGDCSIVGARAVAMKDVPANAIVIGNPARQIKKRDK